MEIPQPVGFGAVEAGRGLDDVEPEVCENRRGQVAARRDELQQCPAGSLAAFAGVDPLDTEVDGAEVDLTGFGLSSGLDAGDGAVERLFLEIEQLIVDAEVPGLPQDLKPAVVERLVHARDGRSLVGVGHVGAGLGYMGLVDDLGLLPAAELTRDRFAIARGPGSSHAYSYD